MIELRISSLRETRWTEYLARFIFGGVMTVAATLIAKRFGPLVGGLFLAFPAIFPSSATLIQKHEAERKHAHGMHGEERGIEAAAAGAMGAALGSFGLLAFAMTAALMLPRFSPYLVLPLCAVVWMAVAAMCWALWKRRLRSPARY